MATNLAYKPDYGKTSPVLPSERRTYQISEKSRPWVMTIKPEPPTVEFDTGLRAEIRLNLLVARGSKLPVHVVNLVERIKELEKLPADWDSYGGNALDDRAVRAAMGVIIEAERTCCAPHRIVPLSSGGLGLRWQADAVELEVDVDPDKSCSATFEAGDEEVELPRGSALSSAMDLIARYRQLR